MSCYSTLPNPKPQVQPPRITGIPPATSLWPPVQPLAAAIAAALMTAATIAALSSFAPCTSVQTRFPIEVGRGRGCYKSLRSMHGRSGRYMTAHSFSSSASSPILSTLSWFSSMASSSISSIPSWPFVGGFNSRHRSFSRSASTFEFAPPPSPSPAFQFSRAAIMAVVQRSR